MHQSLTSSGVISSSVGAEERIIGLGLLEHLLLRRIERTLIVLPFLLLLLLHDICAITAEHGFLLLSVRASDCVGALFGALGGSGVRIFGLVGAALTLWGWSVGLGDVASIAVGVRVGWGGGLLGTTLLGGLYAGCDFRIGVTSFGVGRLGLDGFSALLGSGFSGSGFIVVFAVAVSGSFALGFFGGRGGGGYVADDCAC